MTSRTLLAALLLGLVPAVSGGQSAPKTSAAPAVQSPASSVTIMSDGMETAILIAFQLRRFRSCLGSSPWPTPTTQ